MFISLGEDRCIDAADVSAVFDIEYIGDESTYINRMQEEGKLLYIASEKKGKKRKTKSESAEKTKKKPRSVIITKQGFVILSYVSAATIIKRVSNVNGVATYID